MLRSSRMSSAERMGDLLLKRMEDIRLTLDDHIVAPSGLQFATRIPRGKSHILRPKLLHKMHRSAYLLKSEKTVQPNAPLILHFSVTGQFAISGFYRPLFNKPKQSPTNAHTAVTRSNIPSLKIRHRRFTRSLHML